MTALPMHDPTPREKLLAALVPKGLSKLHLGKHMGTNFACSNRYTFTVYMHKQFSECQQQLPSSDNLLT